MGLLKPQESVQKTNNNTHISGAAHKEFQLCLSLFLHGHTRTGQ